MSRRLNISDGEMLSVPFSRSRQQRVSRSQPQASTIHGWSGETGIDPSDGGGKRFQTITADQQSEANWIHGKANFNPPALGCFSASGLHGNVTSSARSSEHADAQQNCQLEPVEEAGIGYQAATREVCTNRDNRHWDGLPPGPAIGGEKRDLGKDQRLGLKGVVGRPCHRKLSDPRLANRKRGEGGSEGSNLVSLYIPRCVGC
jgi:hypothetical protein